MHCTRPLARKKNLLLCFDAFDTLYKPNIPVPAAYAFAAQRHGINCVADTTASKPIEAWKKDELEPVYKSFRQSFKYQTAENPNYGKATGLGAEKWWANVIQGTFNPFLKSQQKVPEALVAELLERYSSQEGYDLFPDVKEFFDILRKARAQTPSSIKWKWECTVVGIITNSDDRVLSILSSFGLQVGPRRAGTSAQCTPEATAEDISFVVLSYDVGCEKPDCQIFDAAISMLKQTLISSVDSSDLQSLPSIEDYEKLYVGDSVEKDYLGAERAGWNAVLIDRQRVLGDEDHTKIVTLENGEQKKIKVVHGIDELVNWSPEKED